MTCAGYKVEVRIRITSDEYSNIETRLQACLCDRVGFNDSYFVSKNASQLKTQNLIRVRDIWYPKKQEVLIYDRCEIIALGNGQFLKKSLLANDKIYLTPNAEGQAQEFLEEIGYEQLLAIERIIPTQFFKNVKELGRAEVYLEKIKNVGPMVEIEFRIDESLESSLQEIYYCLYEISKIIGKRKLDMIDSSLFDYYYYNYADKNMKRTLVMRHVSM